MKKGGCWIFLSHSSHDIANVRFIRNEFERYSHNPLAFHLRCLNDETPEGKAELNGLIKREIDCREWFVFCESPDAANSPYVQMEKEYILEQGKQKVWSIDMGLTHDELREKVKEICSLIKVFISYAYSDRAAFSVLEELLIEKDYDVWDSEQDVPLERWDWQVSEVIQNTAKNGFAVALLTEDYVQSKAYMTELAELVRSDAELIPLVFGKTRIPVSLLDPQRCFRIPAMPTAEDFGLIVELIEEILKSRIVGPVAHRANTYDKINEIYEKLNYQNRYHAKDAVRIGSASDTEDWPEIYEFPCCGTRVVAGRSPVSRFRADGCICNEEYSN